MTTPEQEARERIDALLQSAGWSVQNVSEANIHAARGVAICDQSAGLPIGPHEVRPQGCGTRMCRNQFPLKSGHGFADYLFYIDGKAAGVIEAKKQGVTLSGVETQAAKYTKGLPDVLPAWRNPLPFAFQSTGVETRCTSGSNPEPRPLPNFACRRPETIASLFKHVAGMGYAHGAIPSKVSEAPLERHQFVCPKQSKPRLNEDGIRLWQVLELVDMATTEEGGTFLIHKRMYEAIASSEIIICDLTGHRANVFVEAGYALKSHESNRLIFMFEPAFEGGKPPFDLSPYKYVPIAQAAEIPNKVEVEIVAILREAGAAINGE